MSRVSEKVILSCIDGSSVSEAVCDYSAWIAGITGRELKLLHILEHQTVPAISDFSGAIGLGSQEELLDELTQVEQARNRLLIKKGQLILDAAKQRVMDSGIKSVQVNQRHGTLVESLVELEDQVRLLVVGIRGKEHDSDESAIGNQLESIIRSLHQPILVVNTSFSKPKKIMLAYDASPACKKALQMVAESQLFKQVDCHLVHVGDKAEIMLKEASQVLIDAGVKTHSAQLDGEVKQALIQYQADNQIDLTVMGAFSHSRFRNFLVGSFTAKMLMATQKPLLLLR
jgi:nucleotide-binding universal stress UspA family protein